MTFHRQGNGPQKFSTWGRGFWFELKTLLEPGRNPDVGSGCQCESLGPSVGAEDAMSICRGSGRKASLARTGSTSTWA